MKKATISDGRLLSGQLVTENGKVFAICRVCRTLVRVDKPILGSLHFCDPPFPPAQVPAKG